MGAIVARKVVAMTAQQLLFAWIRVNGQRLWSPRLDYTWRWLVQLTINEVMQ